jgi:hypothetical protein
MCRVDVLDAGVRLTPSLNLYRFAPVFIPWEQIARCDTEQRDTTVLDGAVHTALFLQVADTSLRVPGDAGVRIEGQWRFRERLAQGSAR